MGYVHCFGECCVCHDFMGFNPVRVPSLRIIGIREPVCERCMLTINAMRESHGLDPFWIHPEAYSACDESELPDD